MRVSVWTRELALYAPIHRALSRAGWEVFWNIDAGFPLADLRHWAKGRVWFWPTPWGLRVYDPGKLAFLTRGDDPRTLPHGLLGRVGLRLSPLEARLLWALGQGVAPSPKALASVLGASRDQARFALRSLRNKMGLPLGDLLRLARHQVEVAGLQDHLDPPPGREVEPGLHVPGEEEGEGEGALEAPPVGQALGVEAFQ